MCVETIEWFDRNLYKTERNIHHTLFKCGYRQYKLTSWLCAWDVCYIIFCHSLYIHSGKTCYLFSLVLCSLWWVQKGGYVLACRSYSFVCTLHHLIIIIVQVLSEDIEHKMHVGYNLSSVWISLSIFSQLLVILYTICGAVCYQFTHWFCDNWENIYTLSYCDHQIGSLKYYPLFRGRSWNNGIHCRSFNILAIMIFLSALSKIQTIYFK